MMGLDEIKAANAKARETISVEELKGDLAVCLVALNAVVAAENIDAARGVAFTTIVALADAHDLVSDEKRREISTAPVA